MSASPLLRTLTLLRATLPLASAMRSCTCSPVSPAFVPKSAFDAEMSPAVALSVVAPSTSAFTTVMSPPLAVISTLPSKSSVPVPVCVTAPPATTVVLPASTVMLLLSVTSFLAVTSRLPAVTVTAPSSASAPAPVASTVRSPAVTVTLVSVALPTESMSAPPAATTVSSTVAVVLASTLRPLSISLFAKALFVSETPAVVDFSVAAPVTSTSVAVTLEPWTSRLLTPDFAGTVAGSVGGT